MQDPEKRIENWDLKYNLDRVKQILDEKRAKMGEHYRAGVAQMWAREMEVRTVLNAHAVNTIQYVPYLNFGRQLYRLTTQRQINGESAAVEAQVLLEKWARRGLDPSVLAAVRSDVFNIPAPPAP
jgi:hypothetical protein